MTDDIRNAIISTAMTALLSGGAALISVSFYMGNANNAITTMSTQQNELASKMSVLTDRFTTINTNQAVMSNKLENMSQEIKRLNQGWADLNDDMKCIRMVAAAKGDFTKC